MLGTEPEEEVEGPVDRARTALSSEPARQQPGNEPSVAPGVGRCGSRAREIKMNQQKAQALARAARMLGRDDEAFRLALGQVWDAAFEDGRLAALDELQDRFCVCMK